MSFINAIKYPILFLVCFTLFSCEESTQTQQRAAQDLHVDTFTVAFKKLRLSNELPGRITAFQEAEVRPQITGIVESRLYEEGSYVKAGDILFQIDPTSYQSTVNSAKAQLQKSLTDQQTTKKEMIRYAQLLKKKLTSQQIYDQAESTYLQAKAQVAVYQAALDYANIQLSYTQIKAPISGYAGFSKVSEGSLLTSGQSDYITTIIQTDNVYIDMKQSAVSLYKLKQQFNDISTEKPAVPVTLTLEDGTNYAQQGTLAFIDTQVDESTGTVTLRALMPNPEKSLLAGMYVRAHIAFPKARDYLLIPQSAVIRSQSGKPSAYIVNQQNIIEKKDLILGNEVGSNWVVESGLEVGERVVLNNLTKIKSNQSVIIDSETSSEEAIKIPTNTTEKIIENTSTSQQNKSVDQE